MSADVDAERRCRQDEVVLEYKDNGGMERGREGEREGGREGGRVGGSRLGNTWSQCEPWPTVIPHCATSPSLYLHLLHPNFPLLSTEADRNPKPDLPLTVAST